MILYKFLNGDKTASAKYITDAFYDVNELKSLRQFYVTELREVSPEIVQAGINIEVGATDYSVYVVEATKDFIPNEFNKTTSNQLSIALGTGVKYKWMVMANIGNSSMVIVPSREFTVA